MTKNNIFIMNISSYLCNYFGEPRKNQTSALRSFGKMLIYSSKLRFCLSCKPWFL